jgi:hypothetical protein
MATYEIEITKRLMKTSTITVPDHVPADDVKEWAEENADDIFDVDSYERDATWDVDNLVEGDSVGVTVTNTFEDHEYEVEGFKAN